MQEEEVEEHMDAIATAFEVTERESKPMASDPQAQAIRTRMQSDHFRTLTGQATMATIDIPQEARLSRFEHVRRAQQAEQQQLQRPDRRIPVSNSSGGTAEDYVTLAQ
jgi:hypothetical protein